MKQFRELPRYDVTHLRGLLSVVINNKKHIIPIRNVSLGGMQIISENEIILDNNEVEVQLIDKKPFHFKLTNAWKYSSDNRFLAGFKINFKDIRSFQRWLQVMRALHLHKSKKKLN